MVRRNKEGNRPLKLTEFFTVGPKQDGAGAASTPLPKDTQISSKSGKSAKRSSPPRSLNSPPATPSSGSPEKARFRMDAADASHEVSSHIESGDDTRELPDSIDLFPTNNKPVLDTVLKEMLVSLRSSLHSDMVSCVHKFSSDLRHVADRVSHVETKMGEYASTINALVDANETTEDDIESLKAKIAEMEDRSRRNNLKIRGIPESVKQQDLRHYVAQLFTAALPDMSELDFTVDRIHRLPKPSYLSDNIPRDVILRLHFYHTKEKLMAASRQVEGIPTQYANLQFYADLSQHTLQKRRNLATVTKALRNHKLTYKWGFPTKLIVTKDDREYVMDSLEKGMSMLQAWGIVPDLQPPPRQRANKGDQDQEWRTVDRKNARSHT